MYGEQASTPIAEAVGLTAAIAYLHVHRAMALDAACEEVKARRSCVPYVTALRQRYGDPVSRQRR